MKLKEDNYSKLDTVASLKTTRFKRGAHSTTVVTAFQSWNVLEITDTLLAPISTTLMNGIE